jgi:hypothetical protein
MFEWLAANLYSEDCVRSAVVYSEMLHWKIKYSSKNHSEIESENHSIQIFFSNKANGCKPIRGSITFLSDTLDMQFDPNFFSIYSTHSNYISLLDKYENLLWVVKK